VRLGYEVEERELQLLVTVVLRCFDMLGVGK
jgi:hypothetical protein